MKAGNWSMRSRAMGLLRRKHRATGLKRLMIDLKQGRIETIVVNKVDRLTRFLADFAKIVEVLDAIGASSFRSRSCSTRRPQWGG